MVTGVSCVLDNFDSFAFAAFEVESCREGRADPEMRSAKRTTLCGALQSWFEELPYHTEMH